MFSIPEMSLKKYQKSDGIKKYPQKHFLGPFPEDSSHWKKSISSQCQIRDLQSEEYLFRSHPNGMLTQASCRTRTRQIRAAGGQGRSVVQQSTLEVLTHTGGPHPHWRSSPVPDWPWSRRSIWAPKTGEKGSGLGGKVPYGSSSVKVERQHSSEEKIYMYF